MNVSFVNGPSLCVRTIEDNDNVVTGWINEDDRIHPGYNGKESFMKWVKKNSSTIVPVLIFFVGLSLLLYPTISDYWNSFHPSRR